MYRNLIGSTGGCSRSPSIGNSHDRRWCQTLDRTSRTIANEPLKQLAVSGVLQNLIVAKGPQRSHVGPTRSGGGKFWWKNIRPTPSDTHLLLSPEQRAALETVNSRFGFDEIASVQADRNKKRLMSCLFVPPAAAIAYQQVAARDVVIVVVVVVVVVVIIISFEPSLASALVVDDVCL